MVGFLRICHLFQVPDVPMFRLRVSPIVLSQISILGVSLAKGFSGSEKTAP